MSEQDFRDVVATIAASIGERALDRDLAAHLNAQFPKDGDLFERLTRLCAQGEAEGWLMARAAGGIKFGRAVKPGGVAGTFSVDVVRMKDIKGPHHIHPTGEIGAVMPISGIPKFDAFEAGWYVYPPGSDHHPTVTDGDAYVLYFLPEGQIEFTGK